MPFRIIRNDITKVRADAIVNTANPDPVYAGGTDHAIYMAAGAEQLLAERRKIGSIHTGEAAVTPAFRLPAKFIIHTVGPAWEGGDKGEFRALASCYRKSLLLAKQLGCTSIAFPLISTGVYGFPKDKALSVATKVISDFLEENEMDVTLVVFNKSAFVLSKDLVESVSQFIDDRYVEQAQVREYGEEYRPGYARDSESPERSKLLQRESRRRRGLFRREKDKDRPFYSTTANAAPSPGGAPSAPTMPYAPEMPAPPPLSNMASSFGAAPVYEESSAEADEAPGFGAALADEALAAPAPAVPAPETAGRSLKDLMKQLGESFQEHLLRLIDERNLTDTEVYKRANLDRKLFSKIRCNPAYSPSKRTVLALAAALHLNLDETKDLLGRAGFAFSPGSKSDLIVEYCIENRIYDIYKINLLLFEYDQQTL